MNESLLLELSMRSLHFLGIFTLVASLVTQNVLLSKQLSVARFNVIRRLDAVYGMSAMVTLGAGLMLWWVVGKHSDFYTQNPVFMMKIGLFTLIALLSFIPTFFFLRQRGNGSEPVGISNLIVLIKRLELFGILFLPVLAVLMARGIGL